MCHWTWETGSSWFYRKPFDLIQNLGRGVWRRGRLCISVKMSHHFRVGTNKNTGKPFATWYTGRDNSSRNVVIERDSSGSDGYEGPFRFVSFFFLFVFIFFFAAFLTHPETVIRAPFFCGWSRQFRFLWTPFPRFYLLLLFSVSSSFSFSNHICVDDLIMIIEFSSKSSEFALFPFWIPNFRLALKLGKRGHYWNIYNIYKSLYHYISRSTRMNKNDNE